MTSVLQTLSSAGQAKQQEIIWASALTGACFYIVIARASFELEQYLFQFFVLGGALSIGELLATILLAGQSIWSALLRSSLSWFSFLIGFFISLSFNRLFLHRCCAFHGPLLAKLTRFYAAYLNAKDAQYYQQLKGLHETHGDYLRMGPRDISIMDPAAIPSILGPNTKCTKSTWYAANGIDPDKVSIGGIRDPAKYRLRRRAWDRGLSIKAMNFYLSRIKAQTDEFLAQLHHRAGQPLDISKWSMFYSFDIMGNVGFGKPFTNMSTGQEHPAIQAMHKYLWLLGPLLAIPWFPQIISAIPSANIALADFFGICAEVMEEKERTFDSRMEPTDVMAWLLKASRDKDVSASPTKQSLADDSRGVIIAGSDTTANTLANALFYLVKHPEKQQKLRSQLDAMFPIGYLEWNYAQVKTISYIDDIIKETLRLKPPIIQGAPRETPREGIQIGDKYIPGFVNVSIPVILIQRDPRWWKQPDAFLPERWTEKRGELGTDGSPWFPFQLGMHACAGKNLAYLILRAALSAIVLNFDIRFAPGETGDKFDGEFLGSLMMALRPLHLVFTPRRGTVNQ